MNFEGFFFVGISSFGVFKFFFVILGNFIFLLCEVSQGGKGVFAFLLVNFEGFFVLKI
jgi:hypothetical protein